MGDMRRMAAVALATGGEREEGASSSSISRPGRAVPPSRTTRRAHAAY